MATYLEGTDAQRLEAAVLESRLHRLHPAERLCGDRAKYGERQRFVVIALELDQQRHAAQHAVGIEERIDVADGRRALHVRRQIAGVALPLVELGVRALEGSFGQHGFR